MKKLLCILLFILISCSKSHKNQFSLVGITNNIEDGTWLYLKDSYQDFVIDSVEVKNNSFKLKSKIDSFPIRVILHSKDYKNYNFLWIENNNVTFDSSNSDFKNAHVSGSINKLDNKLRESLKGKSRKELELFKEFGINTLPHTMELRSKVGKGNVSINLVHFQTEVDESIFSTDGHEVSKVE